jgi:hypothetical protein
LKKEKCECGHFNTDHVEIDDNYAPCDKQDCSCDDFNHEDNFKEEMKNFILIPSCPECDSTEIRRSAIVTKHVTQAYKNGWFKIDEMIDKLHGDSYIYFCNECDFESEEYQDFGLKDHEV